MNRIARASRRISQTAPMKMLSSWSASSAQAIACKRCAVGGDKRVAVANGPDDGEQPRQDGVVQRNRGEAGNRDDAEAHDQPGRVRRGSNLERRHDPLFVRHDDQQGKKRGAVQPVHDDEDPQKEVCDWQRGGWGAGLIWVDHLAISNINTLFIDYRQVTYR